MTILSNQCVPFHLRPSFHPFDSSASSALAPPSPPAHAGSAFPAAFDAPTEANGASANLAARCHQFLLSGEKEERRTSSG